MSDVLLYHMIGKNPRPNSFKTIPSQKKSNNNGIKQKKNRLKPEEKYIQSLAICKHKAKQLKNIEMPIFVFTRNSQ